MPNSLKYQNTFPKALKLARNATGLSQEDFGLLSSRTYVSSLERGLKAPTLKKIDDLAEMLDIHPLVLLTLSYMRKYDNHELDKLMTKISNELKTILES